MKTLIVDRVKVYQQLIKTALQEIATDIVTASTGNEALEMLEKNVFECICLSMYLDDINGIDLCKKIRKLPSYKYIPIVLLTSENESELIKQANLAGVTDIFLKDKTNELVSFIERFTQINEPIEGEVLYIEDDKSQRVVVNEMFESRGLKVDAFNNAEDAWSAFIKKHYHLVVTDLVLIGEMSGVMLINKIRRIEGAKGKTPILALTAYDDAPRRVSLYHMGIADYVTKPVIEVELMARVNNLIKNQKALEREVYFREHMSSEEVVRHSMKMDAMGKLTGGIAHDYNNMLGVIIGYVELLEERLNDNPELLKYVKQIEKASQSSIKLTHKLLGFARKNETEVQVTNINREIKEIEDIIRKLLTAGVYLTLDLHEDLWDISVNSTDLENSIMNLIINAKHAMQEKGSLNIVTENTVLNRDDADKLALKPGEYVQLSIIDSGYGMSAEIKERIFDPFFSTKGDKGTGLGLSQVYGFTQRTDGAIAVETSEGHGTKFKLYFPREINAGKVEHKNEVKSTESASQKIRSIIVVDDNKELADLLNEILNNSGYKSETANSALEAINKFKNHVYDVMITDIIMPGMNGYELTDQIKSKYPGVKIIITSGYDDKEIPDTRNIEKYSMQLQKPVSRGVLLDCLNQLLVSA